MRQWSSWHSWPQRNAVISDIHPFGAAFDPENIFDWAQNMQIYTCTQHGMLWARGKRWPKTEVRKSHSKNFVGFMQVHFSC